MQLDPWFILQIIWATSWDYGTFQPLKLLLQMCMRSHPVGLNVRFFVAPFVYFHTSCVWTAKTLARLCGCACSLVAYVSTKISWAGSFIYPQFAKQINTCIATCIYYRNYELIVHVYGPRQANLVLIAYASSEGSGEPAHVRSLARTSAARSYKQWVKRNLQTESQIPGPSEWLGMRSWNLSWWNARRHKFAWQGSYGTVLWVTVYARLSERWCICLSVCFCCSRWCDLEEHASWSMIHVAVVLSAVFAVYYKVKPCSNRFTMTVIVGVESWKNFHGAKYHDVGPKGAWTEQALLRTNSQSSW